MKTSLFLFVLFSMSTIPSLRSQETSTETLELVSGQTLEREMSGAETHRYKFKLKADEFFQVRVEQKGVDVAVKLTDVAGQTLATMDSPNSKQGSETLSFVADKPGSFVLEVGGFDPKGGKGQYTIRREPPRPATTTDLRRAEIELLFAEGNAAINDVSKLLIAVPKLEQALIGWKELKDDYLTQLTAESIIRVKPQYAEQLLNENLALFNQGTRESMITARAGVTRLSAICDEINDDECKSVALTLLGKIADAFEENRAALEFYEQALVLVRKIKNVQGEVVVISNIGLIYARLGESAKAREKLTSVLELVNGLNNPGTKGQTLVNLGKIDTDLGEMKTASDHLNEGLNLCRQVNNVRCTVTALDNIATLHYLVHDLPKTADYLTQALNMIDASATTQERAVILSNLGKINFELGKKTVAIGYLNQAVEICEKIGFKSGEAAALTNLGEIYGQIGERPRALEGFDRALALARTSENKSQEVTILLDLANLYAKLGQSRKALQYLDQAHPLVRASNDHDLEAMVLGLLGMVHAKLGNADEAQRFADEAIPHLTNMRDMSLQPAASIFVGVCLGLVGDEHRALEFVTGALSQATITGDKSVQMFALEMLGLLEIKSGRFKLVQENANRAMDLAVALGDKSAEALALNLVGLSSFALGDSRMAVTLFQRALDLAESVDDKTNQAIALNGLASTKVIWGEAAEGRSLANRALAIARETDDQENQILSLALVATSLTVTGDLDKSIETSNQALSVASNAHSSQGRAMALTILGVNYLFKGDVPRAMNYAKEALPIGEATDNPSLQSAALIIIGGGHSLLGHSAEALDFGTRALEMSRRSGEKSNQTLALIILGRVYLNSDRGKAKDYFTQGLDVATGMEDKRGMAVCLNFLSQLEITVGDPESALALVAKALPLAQQSGDKLTEGTSLCIIAMINVELGQDQTASGYLDQAMLIAREIKIKNLEGLELLVSGRLKLAQNLPNEAIVQFDSALAIWRELGFEDETALTFNNLGFANQKLFKWSEAQTFYNQAIAFAEKTNNVTVRSLALNNSGVLQLSLGQPKKAQELFDRALLLSQSGGYRKGEALVLSNLMVSWHSSGNDDVAVILGKRAINIYQGIRGKIVRLDREVQQSFLKSVEQNYRYLIDLMIAKGRIPEAEQVLAMLKEDELFEYTRRDAKVAGRIKDPIKLSAEDEEAFRRYTEFASQLTKLGQEFGELDEKRKSPGQSLTQKEEFRWADLHAKIADANTVFNNYLKGLEDQFRVAVTNDSRVLQISHTRALLADLKQPRTVIISTIAGDRNLNLIVSTAKVNHAHTVNLSTGELSRLVADFRAAVTNPHADVRIAGKNLYDKLFPLALQQDLAGVDPDTVVWSLDGPLRYIPVAALWDGEHFLAERFANVVITLASQGNLKLAPTARVSWSALGVGVSKAYGSFPALYAVPRELCNVVDDPAKAIICARLSPGKKGVLSGVELTDEEFTLNAFELSLGRFPVVHIASHFSLNVGNDSDSFLLLGGSGDDRARKLTVAQARDNLSFTGIDLLTLSACNTAMDIGRRESGAEVEGFGAIAQNGGARSVVATLWSVADDSTQLLMSAFYRLLKENPQLSKAEALRQVQRAMLAGQLQALPTDGSARDTGKMSVDAVAPTDYRHPFYWAPFVLYGNWQ